MRLELVPLPVSDVDRAKAFYEQDGFGNLHDTLSRPLKRFFDTAGRFELRHVHLLGPHRSTG
jgi:hypothetical protein